MELAEEFKPVERGWCVGSEAFRAELLAAASEPFWGGAPGNWQSPGAAVGEGRVNGGVGLMYPTC